MTSPGNSTSDESYDAVGIPPQDGVDVTLAEEQGRVRTERYEAGQVRVAKHVDVEHHTETVQRSVEQAQMDRVEVADAGTDSGQVETLPDGSLSIPVFEEVVVVTKRLVVRERVIVRKVTVQEQQEVSIDLRRERLQVESIGDVVVHDDAPGHV